MDSQKERIEEGQRPSIESAAQELEPRTEASVKEDTQKKLLLDNAHPSEAFTSGETRAWLKNIFREAGLAHQLADRCEELHEAGFLRRDEPAGRTMGASAEEAR